MSEQTRSFSFFHKDDPKDRVRVEVGDVYKHDRFLPQAKIARWDNQANFSIRLVEDRDTSPVVVNGKFVFEYGDKTVEIYPISGSAEMEEGGLEFLLTLRQKPKANTVLFTLQDKNVIYLYQPYFSEIEREVGGRPENVEGSYAVYAKTFPRNCLGSKIYKSGKVGHIYRPKIIDSSGSEVWGELNIDGGILSVTIPQKFLDSALYPVFVDPTFGYTTAGGSYSNTWGTITCSEHNLSEAGDVSKLSAYYSSGSSYNYFTGAIYNGTSLEDQTEEVNYVGADWYDAEFASPVSLASGDYLIGTNSVGGNAVRFHYDSGSVGQTRAVYLGYTRPYTFPETVEWYYAEDKVYSVYATYTTSGSTAVKDVISCNGILAAPR